MPRVLIAGFCSLPGPDRAGVQLQHIVRALVRHHTVDALVLRRGDQAYVERFSGARVLRVPVPEGDFRAQVDAFRRALRRQLEGADYDIVHFRDGWSGVPVLGLQERFRFATVFDVARSPMTEPTLLSREIIAEMEQDEDQCLQRADMILAPSEPARRHLAAEIDSARVHLVPPGVNVDIFDWDEPESKTASRVLYMGSLAPGRGVRVLLRAMLDVAGRSDAHLVLAGRAPREFLKSLKTAVRDLKLSDRVDFPGEIDHEDVPVHIAAATICIAPGAVELSPRPTALYPTKILEYMACRRAVIAPRRTTVTMMMRDEQHGILFDPGQPAHLADQILRLLADAKLRERLARSGYDLVRRMYTASGTRRELRKAYNWLAAQTPWRERFLEVLDELPTMDVVPLAEAGELTRAHDPAKPFESEVTVLDSDTDARSIGGTELGEITRVEELPILDSGRVQVMHETTETARREGWVVEDSKSRKTRRAPSTGTDEVGFTRDDIKSSDTPPVGSRFVAGEVEVPAPGPEPAVDSADVEVGEFTAMTPLLGYDEDSKTDTRAAKPRPGDQDDSTQIAMAPPPPKTRKPSDPPRGRATDPDDLLTTSRHKPYDKG